MIRNESGQMIVEYILIATIAVAVAIAVSTAFKKDEYLSNIIASPWKSLAGIIQNGQWGTPEDTMQDHPLLNVSSVNTEEMAK